MKIHRLFAASRLFKVFFLATAGLLFSFKLQPKHITVYMAGDSTMAIKEMRTYPETGWGMPFANYFDQSVTVDNRAKNGRSTKTFITENLWQPIVASLQEGDYVMIQFGHNDEVPTKASATTETAFKTNLIRFVTETKEKKATPILLTPVARRKFTDGQVVDTHAVYAQIVRDVAKENNVILIDMAQKSMELLQKLGDGNSNFLYNHVAPGQNPNYPDGKIDDTHFNEMGARLMAELVLNDIKAQHLELADRIVRGTNKPTVNPQAK